MAWRIKNRTHGVELVMSGRIGTAELTEANDAVYVALPEQGPRYAIFDLTDANVVDIRLDQVRDIAAADLAASERFPDLLTVVIAPSAANFGVARQWQALADQLTSRVVATREEAAQALAEFGFDASEWLRG